jgi:predicted nucleic acid-binding protein
MSGESFFLDTNVVVYAFGSQAAGKQAMARDLLKKAGNGRGCISHQVVREFVNAATRKFQPAPPIEEIRLVVRDILLPICRSVENPSYFVDALDTHQLARFSWYDSLILQAAVDARCGILYSEGFQHGFQYRGLRVVNPFL